MPEALPETTRPRGAFGLRAALAVLGGVLLMALMGMTVTDVIGRYLFNAPLRGATELTELLLAAVVFLGLPAVALADEHVTVDLVTDRMPAADRTSPRASILRNRHALSWHRCRHAQARRQF